MQKFFFIAASTFALAACQTMGGLTVKDYTAKSGQRVMAGQAEPRAEYDCQKIAQEKQDWGFKGNMDKVAANERVTAVAGDTTPSKSAKGVRFYCCRLDGRTTGVMGIQDVKDVTLIRHAYVRTKERRHGVGRTLLEHLNQLTTRPVLIGTWKAATWAVRFYEKNGFTLVTDEEKNRLLRIYWTIPDRQVEESVVLVSPRWRHQRAS